jgi:1-pyrroline-5-carboxylate dehydrogenase
VREKVAKLKLGDPVGNPNMGPVINKAALDTMLEYVETGKKEGRLIAGGSAPQTDDGGFFLEPTVIADVAPGAVISQEEIFGPVLALIKVESFEEGLRVANNTEYGLTGAIYTASRERLDRARDEFHVGNLYLNRKCTGAMVGAHPFGGFNMSGTDSKAGGPDYLYLFTQAKSVAEKRSADDLLAEETVGL